jgi:soluble lytic murein transglycosylase-like protein
VLLNKLTAVLALCLVCVSTSARADLAANSPSVSIRLAPEMLPNPEPARVSAVPAAVFSPGLPYGDLVDNVSRAYDVPANLIHAVIQVESGYDERALSRTGAMGLMQLMPDTARRFNVDDPYDPRQNIEGGVRYLRSLLDQFPLRLALAAYNAGENAVRRFRGVPPYAETRGYVARILRLVHK